VFCKKNKLMKIWLLKINDELWFCVLTSHLNYVTHLFNKIHVFFSSSDCNEFINSSSYRLYLS